MRVRFLKFRALFDFGKQQNEIPRTDSTQNLFLLPVRYQIAFRILMPGNGLFIRICCGIRRADHITVVRIALSFAAAPHPLLHPGRAVVSRLRAQFLRRKTVSLLMGQFENAG